MEKSLRNLLFLSMVGTLGAIGCWYLLVFLYQFDITEFEVYIKGLIAVLILSALFIGVAIVSFFQAMGLLVKKGYIKTSNRIINN